MEGFRRASGSRWSFLGFPALLTLGYGLAAMVVALAFSASNSQSSEFDTSRFSGVAGGIAILLIVLGLFGLVSVVAMAAGSQAGRLSCTVFVALLAIFVFYKALGASGPAGFVGAFIGISPGVYSLYGMWGPRSSEVFG